ncbi:MAG TPA: hybrid sensor histidine kinase/response regulator [Anaerolineae bacterium]|nr:hybrid sensor histidine kinase/response regulator [Anaerolineae bacterium]
MAGEKVLVVEDKPEMIQILTDYVLGPQGYVTLTALNGEEGLRMALSEDPDLVILDLRMPRMSGLQVLQTLRERQCSVPVIVITAYGSEEVVVRALRLGANDYVAKPFELDEMINVIERVLNKSKREKERARLSQELEKSVKELTKKIELILHGIDEGVFIVDRELRILTFNPAAEKILGWREEEAIGRPCAEIFREKDGGASHQEELLSEAMRKAQLVTSVKEGHPVISKDGQQIFIASSVVPLLDPDGQVVGAMAAFRDVSAEIELDHMKSGFISMVSHELRSPLSHIIASTELMREAKLSSDQHQDLLNIIHAQSNRLNKFVEQILDVSLLEAGAIKVERKPVALKPLIEQITEAFEIKANTHRFELTVPEGPTIVAGDENKIHTVLDNLLENAVNYSSKGSRVSIEVSDKDKEIVISVIDEGIGIPATQLERIFERFHRVNTSDDQEQYGYGLGLYISKRLIEMQGGSIWAESEVGRGSRFSFSLPKWSPASGEQVSEHEP